ncbi:defensin beta 135 [Rhinolophus ferrumequinum]|uniref:Beta-defensin n=1 Tax=Rhinolophus ferrumequinum TaxID=59479 RepID=A0A7J7TZS6_RHIFE|nr:defensin beta 135 [Rhinolophus ferrumequinum]
MTRVVMKICDLCFWAGRQEVRSGLNRYIKSLFSTCWQLKGVCKKTCARKEEYHIFCNAGLLCCVDKKHLPIRTGK